MSHAVALTGPVHTAEITRCGENWGRAVLYHIFSLAYVTEEPVIVLENHMLA